MMPPTAFLNRLSLWLGAILLAAIPMTHAANNTTINVSFDVDQVSDQLVWSFINENGKAAQQTSGRKTGQFSLNGGEQLLVNISATGAAAGATVTIVDAHLISAPLLFARATNPERAGTYPYPSPFFVPNGSASNFGGVTSVGPFNAPQHNKDSINFSAKNALSILNAGRWKFSFVMTVAIEQGGTTSYRVFNFDPETESSSGAVPP